jgi:hypothetical protein
MSTTSTSSIWRIGASGKRALIVPAATGIVFVGLNPAVNPRLTGAKAAAASCSWVGSTAPVNQRVDQASTTSGVQLQHFTCNGTGAQEFSLVAA